MLSKLRILLHDHWEIVSYIFFGGLTTVVNFVVYYPLYNYVGLSASMSNAVAWLVAVCFAFVTNKHYVFKRLDWSVKAVFSELIKFAACRVASGMIETVTLFITADYFHLNGNIWKLIVSVLVIILNYVGSKLFVFRSGK